MTVALTRTKVEQALSHSFEAVAAKLPGGRAVAEARKAAIGAFAALGLPHRRIEEWKYTDLRSALKEALPPAVGGAAQGVGGRDRCGARGAGRARRLSHGVRRRRASRLSFRRRARPEGLEIASLAAALKSGDRAGEGLFRESAAGQEAVIALNTAFMTDGAVVRIAKGARLDKPLLLVFARAGGGRPPRHHAQRHRARRRRARDRDRGACRAPRCRARPGQHAERRLAGRRRASRPRQGHAGRRGREPPRHLAGDAREGGDLSRLPADRGDGARAQQALRHLRGRGRQARHLRRRSWGAEPSTSTPRWWSTTRCPAARAASCSRACWPTGRAACSRAR